MEIQFPLVTNYLKKIVKDFQKCFSMFNLGLLSYMEVNLKTRLIDKHNSRFLFLIDLLAFSDRCPLDGSIGSVSGVELRSRCRTFSANTS